MNVPIRLLVLIVLLVGAVTSAFGQGQPQEQIAAGRKEAIDAVDDGVAQLERTIRELQKKRTEAFQPGKSVNFQDELDDLVELEVKHRGALTGRMAIYWLANIQRSYSGTIRASLRQAIGGLEFYGGHRDTILLLPMLTDFSDVETITAFDRLIAAPSTLPEVRESAQLARAKWILNKSAEKAMTSGMLEALVAQGKEVEAARVRNLLSEFPDEEKLAGWHAEALRDLETIAASQSGVKSIVAKLIGQMPEFFVTEDTELTPENPALAQLAAGTLFRERHLKIGMPAPELTVELVDGEQWSLCDQTAKVIFIQFCYQGCGPCEAMYPVLRKIVKENPDDVAVLTIMTDKTIDPALKAVDEQKMTWSVAWDGSKGPLATLWGVEHFPGCFLFSVDKKLVADGMAAEYLEQVVDVMLNHPELMKSP